MSVLKSAHDDDGRYAPSINRWLCVGTRNETRYYCSFIGDRFPAPLFSTGRFSYRTGRRQKSCKKNGLLQPGSRVQASSFKLERSGEQCGVRGTAGPARLCRYVPVVSRAPIRHLCRAVRSVHVVGSTGTLSPVSHYDTTQDFFLVDRHRVISNWPCLELVTDGGGTMPVCICCAFSDRRRFRSCWMMTAGCGLSHVTFYACRLRILGIVGAGCRRAEQPGLTC